MTWVGNQIMWALKYKQMRNYNRGFFVSHKAMIPLSRCWLEQYLESGELKWRLHLDNTINEPSFRFELLCIRAPERSHSSHAVSRIADHWTPLHHCAIRKDIIGQYTLWILRMQIFSSFQLMHQFSNQRNQQSCPEYDSSIYCQHDFHLFRVISIFPRSDPGFSKRCVWELMHKLTHAKRVELAYTKPSV